MAEKHAKQDQRMAALQLFHESSEMMSKAMGMEHPIRGRSNSLSRVIFCFVLTVECLFVFRFIWCC